MRRILAIAWLEALKLLRDPAELMAILLLPLALTLVFGSAFSGSANQPMKVLLVDEDATAYSRQVRTLLADEPSFSVRAVSRTSAQKSVADGDVVVAVIVPRGFARRLRAGSARIETLTDPGSDSAFAASAVVRGIATRMSGDARTAAALVARGGPAAAAGFDALYARADAAWKPAPPVAVKGQTVVASAVRGDAVTAPGNTQYSTGFAVMFIMFVTFGGAGGILEEREQGTLRRLLSAPLGKATLMAGKVGGIVLTAIVQALVLVGVGALVFHVPWGASPLAAALVLLAYILAVTGLAVLVSALVRTRDQLAGLGPLLSTGLAMLGGCFWQLDIVSPLMQTIARLTPSGWAMIGLTDIVARNRGLDVALLPAAVLLGFAVVTLGLGVKLLRFE